MTGSGDRIERLVDFGVAALFGIACAFPALMLLPRYGESALAAAGLLAVIAFVGARKVLGRLGSGPRQPVEFDLLPLPDFPSSEPLELGAEDRLAPSQPPTDLQPAELVPCALELDDVLPVVGPGSRVVQLFGTPAQATAGELAVRIDRHLSSREASSASPPDASGELFDALDQLRRSLR